MNRISSTLNSASLTIAGLLLLAAPLAAFGAGPAPVVSAGPGPVVHAVDSTNPWD